MNEADARQRLSAAQPEVSMLIISVKDAEAIFDIRCELERARNLYPLFPNLYAAKDEIFSRMRQLSVRLTESNGEMDAEVKRKLVQTAVMCLRALGENEEHSHDK